MQPQILDIDAKTVDNAVSIWREGGLVAFPTETVYGLGADATNNAAVAQVFALKDRPKQNPLIMHVADEATARRYVQWNKTAEKLAEAFWPGPLTLVMKRRVFCPISELVCAGGDTLAIRIPANPIAQQLLKAFGGGIAAPSANRSGRISPTMAQHVRDEFGEAVKLIIDGGPCQHGVESSVVDVSGDTPALLRPGSITKQILEAVLYPSDKDNVVKKVASAARQELLVQEAGSDGAHKSPGMLASHYKPSIPMRLYAEDVKPGEALLAFGPEPLAGAVTTLNLSPSGDVVEAAANLFAYMRALDKPEHTAIVVMPIPAKGLGEAIADRLKRASA